MRTLITILFTSVFSWFTLSGQEVVAGPNTGIDSQDSTAFGPQAVERNMQDTIPGSLAEVDSVRLDTITVSLNEDIELFGEDEPLEMNLVFDLRDLLELKDDEEYMDAVLNLYPNEDTVTWNIRIKARGEFRRNFCSFPPIMINAKGVDDLPAELKEKKTIKLVTHCKDRREYREYVFAEYIMYKMYALISPYSFNVRLVRISYIDEADPDNIISSYGFLIENMEHLAIRNHASEADEEAYQQQDMIPEIMAKVAVFQYMVGNVDWQAGYHNVKVLVTDEDPDGPAIPVPYDFDQTGFVNPEYGVIRTNLGLKTIRDRRYLGDCTLNDLLPQILDEYAELREGFVELIEGYEWLDNRSKRDLISYLDEFYEPLMNDRSAFVKELQGECVLNLRQ